MMTRTVFGTVRTHAEATKLVDDLQNSGFPYDDVSILVSDEARKQASRLDTESHLEHAQTETHAPDGAAIGATAGTALGGALGFLAGLGALAIPGLGFILAAGPIIGMLGGFGVGAAVGGLGGTLVGLGIPEHHARRYEMLIRAGNVLVAAHCETSMEQQRAAQIFARAGAANIVSSIASTSASRPPRERISASYR